MAIHEEIAALKHILAHWDELASRGCTQAKQGSFTYRVYAYPGLNYPESVFGIHRRSAWSNQSIFRDNPFTVATRRLAESRLAVLTA